MCVCGELMYVCMCVCVDLKQVLVGEVAPGVELEDEDVVDPGLPPAVRVDAQQEEELDQQEAAAVDPDQGPHVLTADEHYAWGTTSRLSEPPRNLLAPWYSWTERGTYQ